MGDDLTGTRLDHPDLVKTERVEPDRVLGVVLAPPVVGGELLHELERELVAGRVLAVDERARHPLWFLGAQVRRLQDRAERPLGRHRVSPNEFPVAADHAAEVLGPRPVCRRVEENVADSPRPELLWLRREAQERIDLLLGEEPHGLVGRNGDPVDVFPGIESHMREHRQEHVSAVPTDGTATARPFRSLVKRIRLVPNSS